MYDRDTILTDLRQYVIEVHFTKVNGDNRVMRCTLRPDLLPENYINEAAEEKAFHRVNPEVIAAWDVQKGGWRSFRVDTIDYLQNVNENY